MILHHPNGDSTNNFFPNKTNKQTKTTPLKTQTFLYDFWSSMKSGSLFQGQNSALPKNTRNLKKPFETTPYNQTKT
ncbi:hypothetical protein, partial [Thiolapillus sp.]|uniref:hypothetical protein n=1 Tax=Thiolapillus sp. TaxID=2017437 RepID=UPI003AF5F92B